ncbi:hypothetical protein RCH23_003230 [Cryobacterium sp. CAN_C3]|nr:hypothetical protein [Cryobacterium sp. CAN_C3]
MDIYFFGTLVLTLIFVLLGSRYLKGHPRQIGTHLSAPRIALFAIGGFLIVNIIVSAILYLSTK